jgi:hypothetical protein
MTSAFIFPPFPGAQTPEEAIHDHIKKVKTIYSQVGCGDPIHGMVRALFKTHPEYATHTGNADRFDLAVSPGPMPIAGADGFPQWAAQNKIFRHEQQELGKLNHAYFASLDDTSMALCLGDSDTEIASQMTGQHIMATLAKAYGQLNQKQLNNVLAKLNVPYNPADSLIKFIQEHKTVYKLLRTHNLAPADFQKIATLTQAIKTTSEAPYKDFFNAWTIAHKTISDQEFDAFCTALVDYSVVVPPVPTVASEGFGAMVSNQKLSYTAAEVQLLLAAQAADFATKPAAATQRKRSPRSGTKKERTYCYTHGYFGHTSHDCKFPNDDHKSDATSPTQYPGGCTTEHHSA